MSVISLLALCFQKSNYLKLHFTSTYIMIIGNDLSGFCAIIMLIVFEIVTDPKAQKLWGYYAGVGMMFLEVCMILQ